MESAFPGREIRRTVLLRDPISLQVSLYNFRQMNSRARGLGTHSFDLHLGAVPRDFMADFLLRGWLGLSAGAVAAMGAHAQYATLNAALAGFWFVGSWRDCDQLVAAIAPDLEVPARAQQRNTEGEWLEQVDWTPLRRADLPDRVVARIRREHALDQALWEAWAGAGHAPAAVAPPPLTGSQAKPERLAQPLQALACAIARDWSAPQRIGQARRVARADRARSAKDWPTAAARYARALKAAPKSPALALQLARALAYSGDRDGALAAYRRALALKPGMAGAAAELAALEAGRLAPSLGRRQPVGDVGVGLHHQTGWA